jgi:hypothetical protein
MRLTGYLFCLSLATAAGVLPADAGSVRFPGNLVSNSCHMTLRFLAYPVPPPILPGDRITLQRTERHQLTNVEVRLLKDEDRNGYEAEGRGVTKVFPSACFFERCDPGRSISMTCYSDYREIIVFRIMDLKKRRIHR